MTDSIRDHLRLAPDGKLEYLSLAGTRNLLHEWDHTVDLSGKLFRPAGWDECFPTIDPYGDSAVMGDLIGWLPDVIWQAHQVEQIWRGSCYEAQRRFSLVSASCLQMTFTVENYKPEPFEFLWASHTLFGVEHLITVDCDDFMLSEFASNGTVSKQFARNTGPLELVYADFRLRLSSDQPWWGIWLNRGGWSVNGSPPFCCLGLEATNTPAEVPTGQWLEKTFSGHVTLEVLSD